MNSAPVCAVCGKPIQNARRGRPAKYCGNACRQRAFRMRSKPEAQEQPPGEGLPEILDEFVGRIPELRRLRALRRTARLLTLVGPGGAGKTRLALRLASGVRGGGARLVELDSVGPHDLLRHVFATLELRERPGEPLLETLVATLRDGNVWLLLDNCEHIAETCAHLVDTLLRRCPGLRVLATSREPLRVPGEVVYRVGALSLPEPGAERDLAELQRSDAVRLFVTRAEAGVPGFALTAGNAGAVAELCRWLDGLPLAIELAARRAGQLPLERIAAWLTEHPSLLADGARTGPSRHRDLRATIGWSYRLLEPAEQALFRRVSVLPGGFDLEAARAVSGFSDVAGLMAALEVKSLIERTPDKDAVRYRQLNALRGFGLERLAEEGESGATRGRAVGWLAGLAEALVRASTDDRVIRRLHAERENLAMALERTTPGDDQYVLLALALAQVWYRLGQLTACRTLLAEALRSAPGSRYRVFALAQSARAACMQGASADGLRAAEEAVALGRADDDCGLLAGALDALAFAFLSRKRFADSVAAYREAVAVAGRLGRLHEAAVLRHNLAWALLCAGEVTEAAEVLEECLPVLRSGGPVGRRYAVLHTYGAIQLAKHDFAGADATFTDILRDVPPESQPMAYAVEGLAIVAVERGDQRRALRLFGAASELRRRIALPGEPQWRRQVETASSRAERELGAEAATVLAAGRTIAADRMAAYATSEQLRPDPLSLREFEVARLVAEGLTNRQIATDLHVSAGTVAAHLDRIRDKVGLRSRTQIALWVAARTVS
ncbi:MAG TPA: LuxR C-terminal-related transcriptional regulator [Amycolatopsis sp.]|nr:LuxR C-terminal-related transcriptional regulator [Amycolatopsis sp.]